MNTIKKQDRKNQQPKTKKVQGLNKQTKKHHEQESPETRMTD